MDRREWHRWSDCDGDLEGCFGFDRLLTNLSIYWFTGTINSAMRLYYENARQPFDFGGVGRIEVPTAFCFFPRDFKPTRERAEQAYHVVRWSERAKGGHFPALGQPAALIANIRAALRPLR